ncbi:MAG: HisA/HisF-related TIM barrel protein [Acidimicrobiia bacterium]
MQIIPAVDVLGGSVVRLFRGRYDEVTEYATDPIEVASAWMAQDADLVHVVDLDGARTGEPNIDLWESLSSGGLTFQIGGGIRDVATAERAIESGAARVVVGTVAVHGAQVLGDIVSAVGTERVVAAIDVRDGRARGAGWTDDGEDVRDVVDAVVASGVGVALVTGIEKDGAMRGPNLQLIQDVRTAAPLLGVIASGGVDSLESIALLASSDCHAAVVGRALYERTFTLKEAFAVASAGNS